MEGSTHPRVKPVAPRTGFELRTLGGLLFLIGLPLVVLTTRTETYFSWTIEPPLTAASLGACYWGSSVLVLLSAGRPAWAHTRVVMPGVAIAGTLLLLATLIHFDRFHMDKATGWVWLVLYSLLPPAAILLVIRQRRVPGRDPPRRAPLPRWAVLVLGTQALLLVILGVALFVLPAEAASLWSWTLTPLTARAIGAWLVGIGASAAQAVWEGDWERIRVGMLGYAAIAALELVALARFADTPDWSAPSAWILVLFLVVMLAMGLSAAVAGRPHASQPASGELGIRL
jgi:hypothetical protein